MITNSLKPISYTCNNKVCITGNKGNAVSYCKPAQVSTKPSYISFKGACKKLLDVTYGSIIKISSKGNFRLTKFDTPEIIQTRKEVFLAGKTAKPLSLASTAEIKGLRAAFIKDFYGKGAEKKERQLFLTIGMQGSGKSTVGDKKFQKEAGALIMDKDSVRKLFEKHFNVRNFSVPEKEVEAIHESLIKKAVKNGDNVAISNVGANYFQMVKMIKKFKDAGYKVHLNYVDVPTDIAAQRVVKRFEETGKFVDPFFFKIYGKAPHLVYRALNTFNKDLLTSSTRIPNY